MNCWKLRSSSTTLLVSKKSWCYATILLGRANGHNQKNDCVLRTITKLILYLQPEVFETRSMLAHFCYGPFTLLRQIMARANQCPNIEFVRIGKSSETWAMTLSRKTKKSQQTNIHRFKFIGHNTENSCTFTKESFILILRFWRKSYDSVNLVGILKLSWIILNLQNL